MEPQQFLATKIKKLRDTNGDKSNNEAGEQSAFESAVLGHVHPLLGIADFASKAMGGEGVIKEFKKGVVQEKGDPRSGDYDIVLPPMPF